MFRNLSLYAPGNLIDDLQLRNLHDFLQSGCSTHLRLHLRIVGACVWLLNLFLLHNWDVNYSFSEIPQFFVPSASLAPCIKFREFLPPLLSGRFESVWTWRYVTISLVNELAFVQHVRNPHRRYLPRLHLTILHVLQKVLDCWNLPLCHHGRLICPRTVPQGSRTCVSATCSTIRCWVLSNRDSLLWNAVNNFNDLLHRTILDALLCSDLHNFHDFFHNSL